MIGREGSIAQFGNSIVRWKSSLARLVTIPVC
jgi:hypothetical protein